MRLADLARVVPIGAPPPTLFALRIATAREATHYWKTVETTRRWWDRRMTQQAIRQFRIDYEVVARALRSAVSPAGAVVAAELAVNTRRVAWDAFLWHLYEQVGGDFATKVRAGILADDGKADPKPLTVSDRPVRWWTREVAHWLNLESATRVRQITDTTRTEIRKRLAEGVARGESIDQLARRLKGLYEEYYRRRSVTIARTEVIGASNLGSRAGAIATGLALDHYWIATHDNRTRAWHAYADGQQQELDRPYTVGGERLLFPGDTSLGATGRNIVNCRCTEGYVRQRQRLAA